MHPNKHSCSGVGCGGDDDGVGGDCGVRGGQLYILLTTGVVINLGMCSTRDLTQINSFGPSRHVYRIQFWPLVIVICICDVN
ncbi:Hypothetical predicted protein [Octopus vulgaris]|uniref:Uncharacterized protein n=1 Tax=Octopus vulgaris TaxID=6645 RepID=A0AA36BBF9_OCTVU|nr:Hypothetical predicted protein [Octopus vulgaris]